MQQAYMGDSINLPRNRVAESENQKFLKSTENVHRCVPQTLKLMKQFSALTTFDTFLFFLYFSSRVEKTMSTP